MVPGPSGVRYATVRRSNIAGLGPQLPDVARQGVAGEHDPAGQADKDLARVGPTTPTRFRRLPLTPRRPDRLKCCQIRLSSQQLPAAAHECVPRARCRTPVIGGGLPWPPERLAAPTDPGHPRSHRHRPPTLHDHMHSDALDPQIPTPRRRPLLPPSTIRMRQVRNSWGRGGPKTPAVPRPKSSSPSGFKIFLGPAIFLYCALVRGHGVAGETGRADPILPSSGSAAVVPRPPPPGIPDPSSVASHRVLVTPPLPCRPRHS
jgi:hypothetical protein